MGFREKDSSKGRKSGYATKAASGYLKRKRAKRGFNFSCLIFHLFRSRNRIVIEREGGQKHVAGRERGRRGVRGQMGTKGKVEEMQFYIQLQGQRARGGESCKIWEAQRSCLGRVSSNLRTRSLGKTDFFGFSSFSPGFTSFQISHLFRRGNRGAKAKN